MTAPWVARGPLWEGEKVDDACGKLVMLTATAREKAAFLKTERSEFDIRVDICTNMTVNRLHAQPAFQKPDLVRVICDESSVSLYRRLCIRSGRRR